MLSVCISLVVCVSVLSVCSRVSCGFVGLDGVEVVAVGERSRVAGAWLRCVCVSLSRLVLSFFCFFVNCVCGALSCVV